MEDIYSAIFKRKTMRWFDESLQLSEAELAAIRLYAEGLEPLTHSVRTVFDIVPCAQTSAKRGEYCLLLYSDLQPLTYLNAGYLMAQMDLFFAFTNIGACWHVTERPEQPMKDGLRYICMLAFGKCRPQDFRKDSSGLKRLSRMEIWRGHFSPTVTRAVCAAPSAFNVQPWRLFSNEKRILVCRDTFARSAVSVPTLRREDIHSIDMGICLLFLETALAYCGYLFERTVYLKGNKRKELQEVAEYQLLPEGD